MTTATLDERGLLARLRQMFEEARGIGSDAGDIATELRELASLEVALAKAEAREQASLLARAAMFGAAAFMLAGILAVFLFITTMTVLDVWMPQWLAALLTTLLVAALTATCGYIAYDFIRRFRPVPERTLRTIREDISWALHLMK